MSIDTRTNVERGLERGRCVAHTVNPTQWARAAGVYCHSALQESSQFQGSPGPAAGAVLGLCWDVHGTLLLGVLESLSDVEKGDRKPS